MNEINTGGQAFPSNYTLSDGALFIYNGMTMRDYFAAKAMQSSLITNDSYPDENWRIGIAMDAYKMADAMLAEREKGE